MDKQKLLSELEELYPGENCVEDERWVLVARQSDEYMGDIYELSGFDNLNELLDEAEGCVWGSKWDPVFVYDLEADELKPYNIETSVVCHIPGLVSGRDRAA